MSQSQSERQTEQETLEVTAETGTRPAVVAAGASVLMAWYFFFLRKDREMGLFVGLWPPTILAFASYFNQTEMREKLKLIR
jgi:hypothetical protein